MNGPRVLFYVQYLEGIGHVMRGKRIAEALADAGCAVTLVLGGNPIAGFTARGVTLRQLPPVNAAPDSYSRILKPDGTAADDDYKADRRNRLRAIYDETLPDVLITEAFPMGRWAMQFELEPLLAHAHAGSPRPLIIASLRDILQMPKSAEKWQTSIRLFERYYDAMLVHGDPTLTAIEDSFPPLAHLLGKAHYTGLVVPYQAASPPQSGDTFDVIVSAGGGAIAYEVLRAAIGAKPFSVMADARWLALAGPRMPHAEFDALAGQAALEQITLDRYRTDLTTLMSRAQLSIQRAGYNTVGDLLIAGCRGLLVPDAAGNQTEQPLRAATLAALGRAVVIEEATLSPRTMASAIDRAIAGPLEDLRLDVNGATRSVAIILDLLARRHGTQHAPECL